jgi:hypothetical protein
VLLMIVVVIEIPVVAVTVAAVVVADLAMIAIPISCIIALPIMTGFYPARAGVHWTSPVSVVPLVVVSHRVPVAGYPRIAIAGA